MEHNLFETPVLFILVPPAIPKGTFFCTGIKYMQQVRILIDRRVSALVDRLERRILTGRRFVFLLLKLFLVMN